MILLYIMVQMMMAAAQQVYYRLHRLLLPQEIKVITKTYNCFYDSFR